MQKVRNLQEIVENLLEPEEDIVEALKKSEEEIERGEGIEASEAFKELRQKYGY